MSMRPRDGTARYPRMPRLGTWGWHSQVPHGCHSRVLQECHVHGSQGWPSRVPWDAMARCSRDGMAGCPGMPEGWHSQEPQ